MDKRKRVISRAATLVIVLWTVGGLQHREAAQIIRDPSVGFPFQIEREMKSTLGPPTWFVFARMSRDHYSRESVERIWRYFCSKYPDQSQKLDLRIFVDRKPLLNAESDEAQSTPESQGSPAASFVRQGEGALAGGGDNEFLLYHPDPNNLQIFERIVLKGKDPFNPYAYTGDRDADFVAAAAKGDRTKFQSLLTDGANINARNKFQDTALTEASTSGYLDLVKVLLARGADVNAKNENGWTPLICAASQGNIEIVKLLLENGADLNAKNRLGMSALSRSIYDGKLDTFKLLLARGAEIEFQDQLGDTPLALALGGHPEIATILLERGADVNVQRNTGKTALMRVQREDFIKALLDKGAKVDVRDNDGDTPLIYAVRQENLIKVKLLLAKGADPNVKNNRGETAFSIAKERATQELIQILTQAGAKQ
jgi:ankyrin repeat protein